MRRAEARDIQALIDQQHGDFTLAPWDWDFYAEQVRKAKYDLDGAALTPYFELDRVLRDGVFYAAHELYGLTFKERHDLPVYQKDVRVFEVIRPRRHAAGAVLLRLLRARQQERRRLDGQLRHPVEAARHQARRLQRRELREARARPAGAAQPRRRDDDVPRVRARAARDVREPAVPEPLGHERGARLRRAALAVQRALGARTEGARALRRAPQDRRADAAGPRGQDQEGGDLQPGLQPDRDPRRRRARHAVALVARRFAGADGGRVRGGGARSKAGLDLPQVPPRYRSSYFLHIWANGYAAGYYAYLWAEMLDNDAFAWFTEHGGLTRANGDRFRDTDPVAGQRRRLREDVSRFPRAGSEHRADAEAPGDRDTVVSRATAPAGGNQVSVRHKAERVFDPEALAIAPSLVGRRLPSPRRRLAAFAVDYCLLLPPTMATALFFSGLALRVSDPAGYRAVRQAIVGMPADPAAQRALMRDIAPVLARIDADGLPAAVKADVEAGELEKAADRLQSVKLLIALELGGGAPTVATARDGPPRGRAPDPGGAPQRGALPRSGALLRRGHVAVGHDHWQAPLRAAGRAARRPSMTLLQGLERFGAYFAVLGTLGLGLLDLWRNPNRRLAHDLAAETVVVRRILSRPAQPSRSP